MVKNNYHFSHKVENLFKEFYCEINQKKLINRLMQ